MATKAGTATANGGASKGGNARPTSRNARKPQKTAMLLAQRIVGEIADRRLAPGSPLLSERDMLEEYGVARGTLREALRFLEIQNVIAIKTGPGGGPVVAEPSSRPLASTIALLLQLTDTPFRSVIEARMVLEPELAARAAARISPEQLAELKASVERMREHLDDIDYFLHENDVFHQVIGDVADNHVFALTIASLNWISDASPLGVEYPMAVRETVLEQHERIAAAIGSGDAKRASEEMTTHIGDFVGYVERYYPKILDQPLRWDQVDW